MFKFTFILSFCFIMIAFQSTGQDLRNESLCHFLKLSAPKNQRILILELKDYSSKCKEFGEWLDFTTENDLKNNLTKNPKYLVEYKINEISNFNISFLYTLYKVHKKGKQIMKGIIGSVDLSYCYNCETNSFKLCGEKSNFH